MRSLFIVVAIGLLAVGCGRNNVAPVSGRITLDGKPLMRATIVFQPDSEDKNPGPGAVGKTDMEGRYRLTLMTGKTEGAIIGKHKVERHFVRGR